MSNAAARSSRDPGPAAPSASPEGDVTLALTPGHGGGFTPTWGPALSGLSPRRGTSTWRLLAQGTPPPPTCSLFPFKLTHKSLLSGLCPWGSAGLQGALVERRRPRPERGAPANRYTDRERGRGGGSCLAGLALGLPWFAPPCLPQRAAMCFFPYLFSACLLHKPSKNHISIS